MDVWAITEEARNRGQSKTTKRPFLIIPHIVRLTKTPSGKRREGRDDLPSLSKSAGWFPRADLFFLNGTGVFSCTRVPRSHLLFCREPLLFPGLHGLIDLGRQRGDVSIKIDVLLRVWIHWLTAKEDGVSEVVHGTNGGHKPRCRPARIMESRASEAGDLDVHPIPRSIHRRPTNRPPSRMTPRTAELVEELLTSANRCVDAVVRLEGLEVGTHGELFLLLSFHERGQTQG